MANKIAVMHRAARVLVRLLAGFVAGIAIVVGFGAWLLSRGPLSLDRVAPYVANVLARDSGLSVSIDHTSLAVARGHLVALARGVHLTRSGGGAELTLADVVLELTPRLAPFGTIALTRLIVNRPDLRLERDSDGSFHFGIGDLAPESAEDWGQKFVGDMVRPVTGQGPAGFLTEVSFNNARLTVDDRSLGIEWHAAANAVLLRSPVHTSGNFSLVVGQGSSATTLDGDFTVYLPNQEFAVRVGFKELRPALWADAAASLKPLAALDLPISGDLRAELDPQSLTLRDVVADLRFGQGALTHDFFPGGALSVTSGSLEIGYDAVAGRINLGTFTLDLGAGTASASGTIDGVGQNLLPGGQGGAVDVNLTLGAQGIKVDDFPRLWPERAAANARGWVTQHLRDGTVDALEAHLGLRADLTEGAERPVTLRQLDGTMKFEGLSVEYFRPLPPVRNVVGTARFDDNSIEFDATGGDLGKIRATGATARFFLLDTHDEQAKITVTAEGPLADALAVLDTKPLGYAQDIGLDPNHAAGTFSTHLALEFPLINDLPFWLVDYSADATLSDVALGGAMASRDLSQGALTLKLDRDAAQVDGTAALAGVPLTLSWRQNFETSAAVRTHYGIEARLDDAQRTSLGLNFLNDIVHGPVAVDATYDLSPGGRGRVTGSADLKDAALDVKKLNWNKAPGTAAVANFNADLVADKLTAIRDVTLEGDQLDAKATINFDDQGVHDATLDHVAAGGNDFHGTIARLGADGWRIEMAGKSFDAAGLLDDIDRAPANQATEPPLEIELALDRLIVGPGRAVSAMTGSVASDGAHWQRAHITGRLSDKGSVTLDYDGAASDRPFKLTSGDFGALLKVLDIYDDIDGGTFTLSGHAEDRQGQRTLVTTADGGGYRVVRAPTLARLLSLASISGMNALLTGQGIPFDRVQGDIVFTEGRITLNNARTYGGAIGINASGLIDRAAGQMNISGTLVPAYTLNSVIGDIPVLGNLLVGGEGQGVFASNFRVFGPIAKPDVSVNALSTLAPGFLRNLFLFSPRGP